MIEPQPPALIIFRLEQPARTGNELQHRGQVRSGRCRYDHQFAAHDLPDVHAAHIHLQLTHTTPAPHRRAARSFANAHRVASDRVAASVVIGVMGHSLGGPTHCHHGWPTMIAAPVRGGPSG